MAIYVHRSINGSIKWLGVPAPFCNTRVAWTDNLLVPEARWGDGVRVGDWAWGNKLVFLIGADVMWRSVVTASPYYLTGIPPENVRTTARRVRDALLQEHLLPRSQNFLSVHHIGGDERVNRSDDNWDNLWDEPVDH